MYHSVASEPDVNRDTLFRLEIAFFGWLEQHGEVRYLFEGLAAHPEWFVELVCILYKREGEDLSAAEDLEEHRRVGEGAYRILEAWRGVPGGDAPEPSQREQRLREWTAEALAQTAAQRRRETGAIEVAKVLARAWPDEDGHWPCRTAREIIELGEYEDFHRYLKTAKFNLRGAYFKSLDSGGLQERELAGEFRDGARALAARWPRTATMLDRLARTYGEIGARADEEATHIDTGIPRAAPTEPANDAVAPAAPSAPESTTGPAALRVSRIDRLALRGVGPSPGLEIAFAPRLNLLTGDNSLGKTFVLDVAWWALTGSWPNSPAWTQQNGTTRPAIIVGHEDRSFESTFHRARDRWTRAPGWPMTDSLVLYARVDGGYSIWDPVRSPITTAGLDLSTGYHFTQDELWQGLRAPEPDDRPELEWMCKGLIEDWIDWQARDPDWFDLFREVIRRLSPDGERIDVGEPVRLSPHDAQDVPTLVLPYGEVPIVHASAGMKRILGLAYGMVCAWREHRIIARQFGQTPARGLVILIDELEAHLHPRWQRVILGALFQVVDQIGQADPASGAIDVQIVTSTHAPLVSASAEPLFDPSRDKLFKFALEGREVVVHEEAVTTPRLRVGLAHIPRCSAERTGAARENGPGRGWSRRRPLRERASASTSWSRTRHGRHFVTS